MWIFWQVCQNCSLRVQRIFLSLFLERRVIFWAFSVAERQYPNFGRKKLAGLLKLFFTCPEEQFPDTFLEWKFFCRMKNTRRIVKTTFNIFRGTFLGGFFGRRKFCSSFLFVERNYWIFVWIFWQLCQNCNLRVQRNILKFFGKKSNYLSVFGLWAKVSGFWQKIHRRLPKVHFTWPQQNFGKKDRTNLYNYHLF